MECSNCDSKQILMKGNPYAEHVVFKCQECGNKKRENTNHLRPDNLNIKFSGEVSSE
jgi:DNA-directed RNA polymerase subunit RPC12/RpoP